MRPRSEQDDPARYAAAVRGALTDLDAEARAALLDDLEAHLADVASESDAPLTERLGAPEDYAAELRAAYRAQGPGAAPPSLGVPAPGASSRTPGPRRRAAARTGSRRRRLAALGALAAAAVLLLAGVALVRTVAPGSPADHWTYAQLLDRARAGQVRTVDITGRSAVATDRAGGRHAVDLPASASTSDLASTLTQANVDVRYEANPVLPLAVLAPNLGLVILVAAIGALLYLVARGARRPRDPAG